MKRILPFLLLSTGIQLYAQDTTSSLKFSTYIETYFLYDFNRPADNNRPAFIYSHDRHNEFNINHVFIKTAYSAPRMRANVAFAAGTYMNANYSAEPGVLKNIFEATVGIKFSKRKNLWLDAGIMPSHIGFESGISKECWNLTRSILADNSPYFEGGAKLTYTSNRGKWLISALALNGWQRITKLPGNSLMSWGTQLQFKPTDKILLNSSTFVGTDRPDSIRLSRLFHNFYGIFNFSEKVGMTIGFDFGMEEKDPGSQRSNTWYSPVVIFKYELNDKWTIAGRGEYYYDKNGVIIATGTPNGFKTVGLSCNLDYSPAKNVLARVEWRTFSSRDAVFENRTGKTKKNTFATSSLALSF